MTMLVESLKRLYDENKANNFEKNVVTNEKLQSMIGKSISQEDYEMIVNQ